MVTSDTLHQVHMNNALPKMPAFGPFGTCTSKENMRNGGVVGPSQRDEPVRGSLNAYEQKYSRPKPAVPLSATGKPKLKSAGSRAIQILKDSKSRKIAERANGQTTVLPEMRLGLAERAFGSSNGLVSSGKSPSGQPPNMGSRNLGSNHSHASVSAANGRSLTNHPNLTSINISHRSVVTSGLLQATNIASSPKTTRCATSQLGPQRRSGFPVALRSKQNQEKHELGEKFRTNAAGRSDSHLKTNVTAYRNPIYFSEVVWTALS